MGCRMRSGSGLQDPFEGVREAGVDGGWGNLAGVDGLAGIWPPASVINMRHIVHKHISRKIRALAVLLDGRAATYLLMISTERTHRILTKRFICRTYRKSCTADVLACSLSDKPTIPGCIVLLVEPEDTIIWYCHVGEDEEWVRHEYDIGTQHLDPPMNGKDYEKVLICSIAACQGKFYFNARFHNISVLEFTPEPTFSSIAITDPMDFVGAACIFLVESESELYMVCQLLEYDFKTVYDVTVYKMDFSKHQWCIAEDIGGRTFLIAPCYFGASRSADECGLEKDCVYAIFARDKYFEVSKAAIRGASGRDCCDRLVIHRLYSATSDLVTRLQPASNPLHKRGFGSVADPTKRIGDRSALITMDKTSRVPVPCLALYLKHGADTDKPALFSISEKKAINGGDIPGLTNTNSWVTSQGWILVRDTASATTFLQNPRDFDDKIQLPHLPQDVHISSTCLLSCKPTMPGCVVLLVEPVGTIIWYCHIGDDEKWVEHDYDIGTQVLDPPLDGKDHEKVPICWIAACQGKFYFNGGFESIGVLEFSPSPTFSSIAIIDPIIGGLGVMGMASLYMVESLDELYMVCQMYDSDMKTIYDVTVYRMDFLKQQWCIAEDIGGRAFLVASCYFGASRSADECGLEKDCVYSIFARDKYFEVCKVEDGETEEYDLIEAPDSQGGMWILPVEKK
uniref:KIB1-4 beta-propeller domain-containing protein n=1 Tax=Oryza sativa subsp. japonica TaxID=39947 RepID=Q9AY84_ORYSJ|nr:hypothetical protein [Oryza sativa Japonica Group]AAM19034.1 hypothetical protein [Oryza sativa Japonica Group]